MINIISPMCKLCREKSFEEELTMPRANDKISVVNEKRIWLDWVSTT